jgi:signal transduction histidine kinase
LRNQQVSLTKIMEEVIAAFEEEAKSRNIVLTCERQEAPFHLEADGVKLSIALSNLVKNALQFTDSGGHVTVHAQRESDHYIVTVTDDGIGIPARDLPRVFERFFQVETHLTRRYGGMGLGLAVAKAMIELHRGSIWAESEEGKGSKFSFLVPATQTQEPPLSPGPFVEQP